MQSNTFSRCVRVCVCVCVCVCLMRLSAQRSSIVSASIVISPNSSPVSQHKKWTFFFFFLIL